LAELNKAAQEVSSLKRLLAFIGKRRMSLFAAAIFAVLSTALGLVPYLIVYIIAEKVLGEGNGWLQSQSYVVLGTTALLAILGKGWLYALATRLAHHVAFPVLYDIRMALAKKLTTLPLGFFQINDTAAIKDTMNEKVEQLEEGIAHFIPDMTASTAIPFLTVVTMLLVDWRMGVAALLYVPIIYFSFKWVIGRLKIAGPAFQQQRVRVVTMVLHYVYGMKVIKAFARSDASYDEFRSVIEDTSEKMLSINLSILRYKGFVVGLSRGGLLLVIPVGIWLYAAGTLSIPVFVFFVLKTLSFGKTIFNVVHSGSHAMDVVKRSMDSVIAFLNEPSLPKPALPQVPERQNIRFEGVSFSYDGKREVLKQLSFVAPEGKVTALVGTSGSGKSTIVRLVSRFWDVSGGEVSIGGVDVRQMASLELAKQVSCVFQDVFLFDDTILENIRIGKPEATEDEIMTAAKAARCHDFIMELPDGYSTQIGEHGGRLSGGQRQRISIARAILKDAPILLLDEATAFVDAENEARIQEALSQLLYPKGGKPKTLLVVAHRLGTIRNADQILVVQEGLIEAAGTHEELLGNGSYTAMWEAFTAAEQGITVARGHSVGDERLSHTMATLKQTPKPRAVDVKSAEPKLSKQGIADQAADNPYAGLTGASSYWRKLLQLAGPERGQLLKACLYPLLAAPLISLTTMSVVLIIRALSESHITSAWGYGAILLLALIGQVLLVISSFRGFERYDNAVTKRLRIYLGQHLRRLPMGFFLSRDAGTIQTRLTVDVAGVSVYDSIGTVIRGIVAPLLLFGVLLWLDWRLALISLLGVPAYLWMTSRINRIFDEAMQRQQVARTAANSRILEYIQGIPVIRSFASSDTRLSRYEAAMAEYRDANMAVQNRLTPYQSWYSSLFEIGFAAVLLVGSALLAAGTLDGLTLLMFMVVLLGCFEPIPLLNYTLSRRSYLAAARRLAEVLDEPPLPEPSKDHEQHPAGFKVELQQVSFSYQQQIAGHSKAEKTLSDINLLIPERSMTALVGPSGGGKTTLLNLIARFWDVQEGSIQIGGVDVRQMRADTLMKQISVVFQDVYLFKDTILNNIRFGRPEATMEEVMDAAKAARCHAFIAALPQGYDTPVGEGGGTLSGGEKQRISIARAILKDAPIVLLDEATASIDPENEREIQDALQALSANKTLIVVAHRLSTIRHADQIVVIEQGKLVQQGTHEELHAQQGLYRSFWEERSRAQNWTFSGSSEALISNAAK
jgi:ATP-binding cassette subfamily B protein